MRLCALLVLITATLSCTGRDQRAIKVKILYDPQATFQSQLSTKIQKIRDLRLLTSQHSIIDIHEAAPGRNTFHDIIAGTGGVPINDVDIVVVEPKQADMSFTVRQSMTSAKNACAPQTTCMAFLGEWISGERKEAAEMVYAELVK